jgi:hypothetical protein
MFYVENKDKGSLPEVTGIAVQRIRELVKGN